MGIPTPTRLPPGPTWLLVNYDNPLSMPVTGQFDPKIQEDRGQPKWQMKDGIAGGLPWMKHTGIGHQSITFEFLAISTTVLDPYPLAAWFRLHELSLADPATGRPPVVMFTHGPIVYRGFLVEVPEAPMEYWGGHDFIRSRFVRQVGPVRIKLVKLPDVPFSIEPFTSYVTMTEETLFEDLARQQYGDARFAESLREWNQGRAVGDTLELPRKSSGVITRTVPASPYFGEAIEGL